MGERCALVLERPRTERNGLGAALDESTLSSSSSSSAGSSGTREARANFFLVEVVRRLLLLLLGASGALPRFFGVLGAEGSAGLMGGGGGGRLLSEFGVFVMLGSSVCSLVELTPSRARDGRRAKLDVLLNECFFD